MGSTGGTILYAVAIVALLWFVMIRPQQAQAKKRAQMLTSLKVGDKVITIGGICGVIRGITDTKMRIEIADGIVIEMLRNAISQQETTTEDVEYDEDDEEYDDEDDDIYYDEDDEDDDVVSLEKEKR